MYNVKEILNKVHCADSLEFMKKMPDNSVQLTVTSPPYYAYKDYGDDKNNIENFDSYKKYIEYLNEWLKELYRITDEDGRVCIIIDDKHTNLKTEGINKNRGTHARLILLSEEHNFIYKDLIIWAKARAGHASGGSNLMLGCLEEDTNIILKTGIKKIKDVNVDDKIFTMKDKNIIESIVTNKIDRGLENTFKIQTDKRNITATDNHLFFSNKILRGSGKIILETEGWKWNPLNELSIGDFILVPKQSGIDGGDIKTKVYHNYSKRVKPYSNNFYMERIRNIKEVGIRHVYDLSIHNSDNFLAENMVVHNSYPSPVNIPLVNWFEYILVLRKEGKPRIQRVTQEQKDKSKLNFNQFKWASQSIWNIPAERNRTHPCPFPKEIADRLIRLFSFYGDVVFDPFAGSCTTAVVAKMLGRKSISIDISEEYCKKGRERLNNTEISLDNYAKKPLDNYD